MCFKPMRLKGRSAKARPSVAKERLKNFRLVLESRSLRITPHSLTVCSSEGEVGVGGKDKHEHANWQD